MKIDSRNTAVVTEGEAQDAADNTESAALSSEGRASGKYMFSRSAMSVLRTNILLKHPQSLFFAWNYWHTFNSKS